MINRPPIGSGGSSRSATRRDAEPRRAPAHPAVAPLVAFAASLAVYLATIQPGLGGPADSRLFQLLADHPGTPHAPGYPLYLVLLDLARASVGWIDGPLRANLLSAAAGATAVALLVVLLRSLGVRTAAALGVAMAFAWTVTFWSTAVIAEVYTLNVLLVLAILWLVMRWERTRRRRDLAAATLVLGAALAHHTTAAIVVPGAVLLVVVRDPRVLRRGWFAAAAAAAVLVWLALYSVLVWRTFSPDVVHLGATAGTLHELADVVLVGQHRANLFRQSLATVLSRRLPEIALSLLRQLHLLVPLAVVGLARRPTACDVMLLATLAASLAFVASYSVPDLEVFALPGAAVVAVFAGVGLDRLIGWSRRRPAAAAGAALVLPLAFLVPGWPVVIAGHDLSTAPWIERVVAASPAPSTILALRWEVATALDSAILRGTTGTSTRRVLFVPSPALTTSIGLEQLRRQLCAGLPVRLSPRGDAARVDAPVYVAERKPELVELVRRRGYRLVPVEPHLLRVVAADCRDPVLPAALLVTEVESRRTASSVAAAVAAADFDPRRRVVLRGRRDGVRVLGAPPPADRVRVTEWSATRIVLEATTGSPRWLVITDRVPSFWHAWLDGRGVATRQANVLHRAVELPAGSHRVELRDSASSFHLGWWLAGRPLP